jgi:hypothetical protein
MEPARRAFLLRSCVLASSPLFAAALSATAGATVDAEASTTGKGGSDGYLMNSDTTQRCGTCVFWGGPRRVSHDGKTITVTGLGWCNNPQSPNYEKMTSPDFGPMSHWKKWPVIG